MATADWSEVPADLLWKIIELLPVVDYIRFGGICLSWHAALVEKRQPLPTQLPWLLLPDISCSGTNSPIRTFSLTDDGVHHFNLPHYLRELTSIGSSGGWLLFLDLSSPESEISLFDPITCAKATLPSIATLPPAKLTRRDFLNPQRFMRVVVSPNRSSNFMAFAIKLFTSSPALAREGDKSWTTIKFMQGLYTFYDIIFYKEQLWALTISGQVVVCDLSDISNPRAILTVRAPGLEFRDRLSLRYLVESAGDLLLVWRGLREEVKEVIHQVWRGPSEDIDGRVKTTGIKVFKMDHTETEVQWVETKCLGEQILFLGSNPSVAISSRDFPESKNCIYLTNVFRLGDSGSDLLMYHMKDKSVEPLLSLCMSELKRPQMFWFTPNLSN